MEAEYLAAGLCVQELLWLRQLLSELSVTPRGPTPLAMDNQSAISFTTNPITTTRSKHIDIKHHMIRLQAERGVIIPYYVPSANNVADIFTIRHSASLPFYGFDLLLGLYLPSCILAEKTFLFLYAIRCFSLSILFLPHHDAFPVLLQLMRGC